MWKRMRAWWLCSLIILTGYILCESSKCTRNFDCIDGICNSGFFCLCNENWSDDLCQLCRERLALFFIIRFFSWVKRRNCLKNNRAKLLTSSTLWVPVDGIRLKWRTLMMEYCVLSVYMFTDFRWSLREMRGKFLFFEIHKNMIWYNSLNVIFWSVKCQT